MRRLGTINEYEAAKYKLLQQEMIEQAAELLPDEVKEMEAADYFVRVQSDAQFAAAYDFEVEISDRDNLLGLEQKVEEPAPEMRE